MFLHNIHILSVGETLNRISCIAWLGYRGVELLDMDAHIRPKRRWMPHKLTGVRCEEAE